MIAFLQALIFGQPKPRKKKRKPSYLDFLRKAWRLYYEEAKKRSDEAIEALEQGYKKELAREKEQKALEEDMIHAVFFQPPITPLIESNLSNKKNPPPKQGHTQELCI
jgi:hypothetical protein